MDLIKKDAILFLTQMAERRIDNRILKIEHLSQYTALVKHVAGVHTLQPLSRVEHILKYVNLDVFNDFPALRAEIDGLVKQVDAI